MCACRCSCNWKSRQSPKSWTFRQLWASGYGAGTQTPGFCKSSKHSWALNHLSCPQGVLSLMVVPPFVFTIWIKQYLNNLNKTYLKEWKYPTPNQSKTILETSQVSLGVTLHFSLLPLSDFILNIHASESVKNKSTLFHLCNYSPDMETKLETKYPILVSFKVFFFPHILFYFAWVSEYRNKFSDNKENMFHAYLPSGACLGWRKHNKEKGKMRICL